MLGEDAGPSKLAAIKKHGIQTLSEDKFLELIATRIGPSAGADAGGAVLDDRTRKKIEKEESAVKAAALELEKREMKEARGAASGHVGFCLSSNVGLTLLLFV